MNKLICFAFAVCAFAAQAVTVSGVSIRQRWPWNNLVDVDFTIDGTDGEPYVVELNAVCADGKQKLTCKSLLSEPLAHHGENRIVWDFGRDYPDFKADDLQVSVLVTPFSETSPVYLVIDVSAGVSATSYPIRYTTKDPVHTVGANDPCKTTEIWLKRVKAAANIRFGGSTTYGYATHYCTLTEDYYLGIFPVTQSQWEHVGSGTITGKHSFFTNSLYAATRPVDNVCYADVRDSSYMYPADMTISQDTFIKRLRDRTGLETIDLPTEWQWEYAHRRGTTSAAHSGAYIRSVLKGNSVPAGMTVADKDASWSEDYGTCYVDRDTPTAWGFYSMLGNVWEWCANANAKSNVSSGTAPDDYKGPESTSKSRVVRGGCWKSSGTYDCMPYRVSASNTSTPDGAFGFRLAMTVPKSN